MVYMRCTSRVHWRHRPVLAVQELSFSMEALHFEEQNCRLNSTVRLISTAYTAQVDPVPVVPGSIASPGYRTRSTPRQEPEHIAFFSYDRWNLYKRFMILFSKFVRITYFISKPDEMIDFRGTLLRTVLRRYA